LIRSKLTPGAVFILCASILVASCSSDFYGNWSTIPPTPPGDFQVSMVSDGVRISWKCVPAATHYTVFWGKEPGNYKFKQDTPACSILLTGLKKGDFNRFAVTTWNQRGESDYSRSFAYVFDSDPSRSPHYVTKGNDLMRRGSFQDAYIYFSTAIRLDPQNVKAYRSRARVNEKFDRLELASQDYAMAEKTSKR